MIQRGELENFKTLVKTQKIEEEMKNQHGLRRMTSFIKTTKRAASSMVSNKNKIKRAKTEGAPLDE